MAFSFHIGTKWCHDFPKLAKESGFYFNTRRSRSHIDWNYIDSINIDRVIKERDFVTVDENISNIINYNLEGQYDIKILDSNFVKVFQLAQLAVEYLLYCKQYLDQSVIILKDELKLKIEDNHKLRKEITALEEIIKNLKDKAKERSRMVETKIGDSNGEIHKCPHCPKSFISTMFVKAHVARRHPYITDLSVETSPVHDHYRAETEKLHNEIKMLKERLNQAEKVIKNESDRTSSIIKIDNKDKDNNSESDSIKYNVNKFELIEKQQIKNSKEINDLKSLLLAEIYNLRHKDESSYKVYDNVPEINVKLLISQQEKEIERLRNQLLEKLTPDIERMHEKLKNREDYWRSQIQQMDHQHHINIENLTAELKLTQQAAELLKAEYEQKVSALEKQSKEQSNILTEQSKRLSSLSCNMKNSQVQTDLSRYYNDITTENVSKLTINEQSPITHSQHTKIADKVSANRITIENINSPLKQKLKIEPVLVVPKVSKNYNEKDTDEVGISQIYKELPANMSKSEHKINSKSMFLQKHSKNDSFEEHSNPDSLQSDSNSKAEIMELSLENVNSTSRKISTEGHRTSKRLFTAETESSETSSSVTSTTSESETESVSEIININKNSGLVNKNQTISSLSKSIKIPQHNVVDLEKVKKDVLEKFHKKLRDIGIDPEWSEIPQASYKQKMKIIQHHQSINSKKFLKYSEIKRNVLKEILHRISMQCNTLQPSKPLKKSSLDKLVTNVKSKAMKAFSIPKNSLDVPQRKLHMNVQREDRSIHDVSKASRKSLMLSKEKNEDASKNVNEYNVINQKENWSNIKNSQKSRMLELDPKINVNNGPQETSAKMAKLMNQELHETSTPKQQDSISFLQQQNITESLITTPKHNKGALKSTTVSVINSAKKKVFFDLDNNKNKDMSSLSQQMELNDSDWNVSSISDEKEQVLQKKKSVSTDNIIFKTTQTEKIAEISKKIEEQLRASRRKPIGAIEALFPSTYISEKMNKEENVDKNAQDNYLSSISISNSSLEHSSPKLFENLKNSGIKLPLPTPRSIRKEEFSSVELKKPLPITNDSNLDADIDDILQAE